MSGDVPGMRVGMGRVNYNASHPELAAQASTANVDLSKVGEFGGCTPHSTSKCYACSWRIAHTWADHDRYIGA